MPDAYNSSTSISSRSFYIKKNVVAKKSFSLRYFRYRILRPILKLYNRLLVLKFGKNKPWLCPAAIEILKNTLQKDMKGLEYGSGKSTYFFSQLLGSLTSIEHHEGWYKLVKDELEKNGSSNVSYELLPSAASETKKDIENRYRNPFEEENLMYQRYYSRIDEFHDNTFDFILIDGRARVECSRRAIPKLNQGGIFVLDNSERKRYEPIHEMLSSWPKVFTTTGLTDTTLWFKPQT